METESLYIIDEVSKKPSFAKRFLMQYKKEVREYLFGLKHSEKIDALIKSCLVVVENESKHCESCRLLLIDIYKPMEKLNNVQNN